MSKHDKKAAIIVSILALLVFLYLFLRHNPGTAQAIQQATGFQMPTFGPIASPQSFDVGNAQGYQPPTINDNNSCGCMGNPWQQPQSFLTFMGTPTQIAPITETISNYPPQVVNYVTPFGGSGMSSGAVGVITPRG